ncbi:hypothetical protein HDU81_005347 [Chytriomyces hyalinus]|nr:hypothetical protein HDU81_005347 [Chytriomyces hyalinus]
MPSFELKFDWISNGPQHFTIKSYAPSHRDANQSVDMPETDVIGLAASGKENLHHPETFTSPVDEVSNPKLSSLTGIVKPKRAVSIVGVASRRGYRVDGNESEASQKPGSRALKPSVDLAASSTPAKLVDLASHSAHTEKPSTSLVSEPMQNDQETNPVHHKQEKEGTYL